MSAASRLLSVMRNQWSGFINIFESVSNFEVYEKVCSNIFVFVSFDRMQQT